MYTSNVLIQQSKT